MSKSIKIILESFWIYISPVRKKQFFIMLGLTLLCSLAEILSLGILLPFITMFTQPEMVLSFPFVNNMLKVFGVTSLTNYFVPITIIFAISAIIAGMLRLTMLWFTNRLISLIGADLSTELYRRTLFQNYSDHLARNTSEIISGITKKVESATSGIMSFAFLITSLIIFFSIVGALFYVDPILSTLSLIGFGFSYFIIAWQTSFRLSLNGRRITKEQTHVVKALQEGLGGIRDVLLNGTQKVYLNIFQKSIYPLLQATSQNTFITQAPRYAMEAVAIVLVAFFLLTTSSRPGGIASALPLVAMIAFGGQKLLPIMQQIYVNWATLMVSKAALNDVLTILNQPLPHQAFLLEPKPLKFKESIQFKSVSFQYNESSPLIFNNFQLEIKSGSCVGIIGATGNGKSTLLDLLMCLIEPTKGTLLVDGQVINKKNKRAWQRNIAHVPQSIFLSDASFAQNIAFGVPLDEIDINRVQEAAKSAQLAEFIESFVEGYNAVIGERGVRLSGGQRQRIGIARALYRRYSVIVFDEATSALDSKTEDKVMQAIHGLDKNITLIIVSHRITTLKNCSLIVELGGKGIKRFGSYKDILNWSSHG